jgi:putative selenate reductase molybdopterin-binding subunit
MSSPDPGRARGAAPIHGRASAADKLTGRLPYVLDLTPAGALYGRLIRAQGPHSIVTVDRMALLARPDIVAVLDAHDEPAGLFSTNPVGVREDTSVFTAEARFCGDVVGAVVARSRGAARAAAALPPREEPLPAVLSVEEALASGAPRAHRAFDGNLIADIEFGAGEIEVLRALDDSEFGFDHTYRYDPAPHSFLEPVAAIAVWSGSGLCEITCNAQLPTVNQRRVAQLLGIDEQDVSYRTPAIGGAFGGKEDVLVDVVAALCSRASGGRPVVVETDRAEMTAALRVRHGTTVRVRTGCAADGRITARLIQATLECGPYAGQSPNVLAHGLSVALTLYSAPIARASGACVAINRVPGGAYRGYGGPECFFAVESQIDEIAVALELDPVAMRAMNAIQTGQPDPAHGWPVSCRLHDCLGRVPPQRRPAAPHRPRQPGRYRRGSGIAALLNASGLTGVLGIDSSEVTCQFTDGRVLVSTASPDFGQGLHDVLRRVVARELGVPQELIEVGCNSRLGDLGSAASRGAYVTGSAACLAARALRGRIPKRVGDHGAVQASADSRLVAELDGLSETATFAAPDNALVAGAQFAEVEVDVMTGAVRPLRIVSVHDTGHLIDPARATAQVRGGVIHAVGMTLTERISFSVGGAVTDATLYGQALPPTGWDIDIQAVFVTEPHPPSPIGAKGLGEAPVMGLTAAIANAIFNATGARVRHAPFTPERVLTALEAMCEQRPLADIGARL